MRIPKIIIQTNEKVELPEKMELARQSIRIINVDYEYSYYTKEDRRNFIRQYFNEDVLEAYDNLLPGAYQADLFRYCILYIRGGIYLDTSFVCLKPLSTILETNDEFIVMQKPNDPDIYNAFLACRPKFKYFEVLISVIVQLVNKRFYGKNPYCVTGPTLLAEVWKEYKKIYTSNLKVLSYHDNYLWWNNDRIFQVKYPNYYQDMTIYTQQEHYSQLWKEKRIYKNKQLL